MKYPALIIVGLVGGTQAAAQAPSASAFDTLLQCRAITAAEERLRCFDRTTAELAAAAADGSLVAVNREEARRTRRSLFGFALPRVPLFRGDRSAEDAPTEIEAAIARAQGLPGGRWQVTLEDGAVWQTTEANDRIRDPRAGQTIRIRTGALGGYMLSFDGQRSIRGARVR